MRIKYLPLLLLALVSFQSAGCGQTNVKSQSNENKTTETEAALPKEIVIPAGVKKANYEESPAQDGLLLNLNSDKQIYYQDKLINDSTLKNVLKEVAAKTKKLPKAKKPAYLLEDENVNRIYLKADAGVPFSEVIKILKMVQASSPNEYRAKLIVNPAEEGGGLAKTSNGRYVLSNRKFVVDERRNPARQNGESQKVCYRHVFENVPSSGFYQPDGLHRHQRCNSIRHGRR